MNRSMARTGPVKDGYAKFLKGALLRRGGDLKYTCKEKRDGNHHRERHD